MTFTAPFLAAILAAASPSDRLSPGCDHVVTGLTVATFGQCCVLSCGTADEAIYGSCLTNVTSGDIIAADCSYSIHLHGNKTHSAHHVKILGHGIVPQAMDVPLEVLATKGPFKKLVRFHGFVDDISTDEIDVRHRIAIVSSSGASLPIPINLASAAFSDTPERLLHREVELTGVCIKDYPTGRYFGGPLFFPCGDRPLRTIGEPTSDLFDLPAIPTGRIFSPEELAASGLRTLTGVVTAIWGGNNILVMTKKTGGLLYHRIEVPHGTALPCVGESIQVVGQPETDTYHINFSQARWRSVPKGAGIFPAAKPCNLSELQVTEHGVARYNPDCFGRPFTVRGALSAVPIAGRADSRLHLLADGADLPIDVSACPEVLRDLPLGATVEASGICLMEIDNWRPTAPRPRIRGCVMLLRTAEDLVVIARPPWWTGMRIAGLVAGLLFILFCVLVWNRILNHLVIRRSRELIRAQSDRNASELRIGERTRLAVELHDALSQNLAGVACQIASANDAVGFQDTAAKSRLDVAERMLKSCRTELRNVLSDLRSEALEAPDFNVALHLILKPFAANCSFSIRFTVPRQRLLDSTAHALLCIVRELAGNAIRHGHATHVRIAASQDAGGIHLSVQDNGTGFDPASASGPAEGHFGLDGIRSRLRTLSGTLTFEPASGGGARAIIFLPS